MHGEYKVPGGKLVVVDLTVADGRLVDVQVSGDFFLDPDTALDVINRALEGQSADAGADAWSDAIDAALGGEVALYGITSEGVAIAVARALGAGAAP